MLGAEQGQGLGLCWQGGGNTQVGLTRRRPDPTPPSGCLPGHTRPLARHDTMALGDYSIHVGSACAQGTSLIIIPGGARLPPPGSPHSLSKSKARTLVLLLGLIIPFVL